jgi:hypothetical protein
MEEHSRRDNDQAQATEKKTVKRFEKNFSTQEPGFT